MSESISCSIDCVHRGIRMERDRMYLLLYGCGLGWALIYQLAHREGGFALLQF